MLPDDPRHGENRGYNAHITEGSKPCDACRAAHARYKKQLRTRVYLARGPLRIDATGTHRRIQALCALGYTMREMDTRLGRRQGYTSHVLESATVFRATAAMYAALYDAWCMTIPTGQNRIRSRQRGNARRKDWVPPLAWDNIDDPTERPHQCTRDRRPRTDTDHAIITRALAGERVTTTKAEKQVITRRWIAAGRPLADLERIQGWKPDRYGHVRDQERAS